MKAILRICSLFILIHFSQKSIAQKESSEAKFEKTKSLSKTYPLSVGDKVILDNRFGDINVNTWDKNEVKVDIVMSGQANSETVAQELLDRLSIEEGKNGKEVEFKTKITDSKSSNHRGQAYNHTKFSTTYNVFLPSHTILHVENEFGKINVPDYKGEITIFQKFGRLTAGKLSTVKKIRVEFSGGSTIESVNGGELDFRFSRTEVKKIEGSIKANFEHSGGVKLSADNALKQLTIKNAFTTVYLDVSDNLSANFKIHTNFSEFNNKSNLTIKEEDVEDRRGPKFDHDYSGQSGNGNIPIKINSEFGEVIMGHNLKFDVNMKEDKKNKAKARSV